MISNLITYLIIGVAFNFIFDVLVNLSQSEENRLTLKERFILTLIWPVGIAMFGYHLISNLIRK